MADHELPEDPAARVDWVINAPTQAELERRYDLWARCYEADLKQADDYRAPVAAARSARAYIETGARILDAGAGTGLAGEALAAAGFTDITGIDISAGMLAIAREKHVYRDLQRMDLGHRIGFDDDSFDAVVTVGTTSQMPVHGLHEFVRVVRPGGHIVFTVWPEAYAARGFEAIQRDYEARGRLRILHQGPPFKALPVSEPDMDYEVWVFEVGAESRRPETDSGD